MRRLLLAATVLGSLSSPALAQRVLTVGDTVAEEKSGTWCTPITASGPINKTASFRYQTVNGEALAIEDYSAKSGQQSVRKNATKITICGTIPNDTKFENDERFFLDIFPIAPTTAVKARGVNTIRDDDPAPPPPPVKCPDGSEVPVGQTCPEPKPTPPPPAGDELTVDLHGQIGIVGPQESKLLTGWPTTPTAAPDIVGAFRFDCTAGPAFRDDPIVYPGQPGRSHLHRFFGPVSATGYADATYRKLRETSGDVGSCQGLLAAIENSTLYWMPELFIGKKAYIWYNGKIYYKRYPANSKQCDGVTPNVWGTKQICTTIPNDLKFIWGYDMLTSTVPTGSTEFWSQATATSAVVKFRDIQQAFEATPVGGRFGLDSKAPGCWDGKRTDSPNHRDHVDNEWRKDGDGRNGCKPTHPVVIPGFSFKPSWLVTQQAKDYYAAMKAAYPNAKCIIQFSSDPMARLTNPDLPCGGSAHMDYREGWDPAIAKPAWVDNCINKLLSCSSGETGDTRAIPGAGRPKQWIDPAIIANGWLEDLPADIADALEADHVLH